MRLLQLCQLCAQESCVRFASFLERTKVWRLGDALHVGCNIADWLWNDRNHLSVKALIQLLMLVGFYREVSYFANGLRLPLEEIGARLPS